MSRELEALDFIQDKLRFSNDVEYRNAIDLIRSALIEKEDIDNAEPSDALDELNEIIEYITEDKKVKYKATILFDCEIIKNALTTKTKKEQAFDIAITKGVDFTILLGSKTFDEYNETVYEEYRIKEMLLTPAEFSLLKECE